MAETEVRYFAAARDAAGLEIERLELPEGAGIDALRGLLAEKHPSMRELLGRCSFLSDGVVVRSGSARAAEPLPEGSRVDVLPPFAGG